MRFCGGLIATFSAQSQRNLGLLSEYHQHGIRWDYLDTVNPFSEVPKTLRLDDTKQYYFSILRRLGFLCFLIVIGYLNATTEPRL